MKSKLVRLLLHILNSSWLNHSPCQYKYVGNINAFDRSFLESEVKMNPDLSETCPHYSDGIAALEDGKWRKGDIWDVKELKDAFSKPQQPS